MSPAASRGLSPRTLGCGVLLLVLAGLGLILWLMLRTGPLAERLVSEARVLEVTSRPRPSHVTEPVPGSFAQALPVGLLIEMYEVEPGAMPYPEEADEASQDAWFEARNSLRKQCREVAAGRALWDSLPAECRRVMEQNDRVVLRVLEATRARVGGLPVFTGKSGELDSYLQRELPERMARVVDLAALEMWMLLQRGQADEAVDKCLDTLALARELGLGGGLEPGQLSAASQDIAYRPCAAALDAASLERKHQALEQLALLRQGLPPLSTVLREESVLQQLVTFGPDFLPPGAVSRLPPLSRDRVRQGEGYFYFVRRLGHPWLRRYIWRRNVVSFDAMVAAAGLPPGERQRAFSRIDAEYGVLSGYPAMVSAAAYHRELVPLDIQRLQLAVLTTLVAVDLARVEQGRWSETLSPEAATLLSLEVTREGQARLVPRDAALAEHALTVSTDGAR